MGFRGLRAATRAFRSPWTFGRAPLGRSGESKQRKVKPRAFSPPSVGRGLGRVLQPEMPKFLQKSAPEESRGDRKASGRARRRGTSLSPQLAGEMPRQRQRGRLLQNTRTLQKSAPEESRGDRKAASPAADLWPRPQARNLSSVAPACWGDAASAAEGRSSIRNDEFGIKASHSQFRSPNSHHSLSPTVHSFPRSTYPILS